MAVIFCVLVFIFIWTSGTTACSVTVSSIASSTVYRQTYYTVRQSSQYICGWWYTGRCTRYHTKYIYTTASSVSYFVTYEHQCCTGYHSVSGQCQPYCGQGCMHGSCTSPGVCTCNTGWTGSSCQTEINECNNSLCSHHCTNTQGSYYCSCRENYYLAYDRHSCIDINECTNGNVSVGPLRSNRDPNTFPDYWCEQECVNTPGSYRCDCFDGYQLDNNNQSCSVSITNLTGTAIGSSSIYLTWSLPENETDYDFDYYLVYVIEMESNNSWTLTFIEDYADINSLHPYYNYYCSVAVVTNNITYQYSEAIKVTTHQAAPTGIVQLIAPVILNATTLNITWSPLPLDEQNGIITQYIVVMTEIYTNFTIQSTSYLPWFYINNLNPFYEYSFSIAAITVEQGPSTSVNVEMPEASPSSPPLNVTISIIDSQSLNVSWKPPVTSDQNGIIRYYEVIITESDTDLEFKHSTSNEYIIINGLHPYYTYDVIVSAFTVSSGPFSDEVSILTPEDSPNSPPELFNGTATSPYSVYFTWDSPPIDQHNGIIIGYVINVTILETGANFILYSNTTSLSVNDLRPFRTFVCVIAALTKVGIGPYSEAFSVLTPQDAPSNSPVKLHTISILSRGFSLSWDPPPYSDQNGIISYYVINITEFETDRLTQYTSYTTVLSLSLLHPAYTYYCTIAAFTVALGPYSIQFNVTTDEEAPSQPPKNLTGHVMSSSSVALSWELPPFESRNGLIVSYRLNITSLRSGSSIFYDSNSTSMNISGLTPYTTYSCIIAARTSVGLGPYTSAISFTTSEDAPVAPPRITQSFIVDSESVTLQWNPPPHEYCNGIITKYVVKLQVVGNNNDTLVYYTTNTTTTIGSLMPSYTYQFSVAAYTVAIGPFTTITTLTLPEDAPSGNPQSFTLINTTPSSMSLKWSPPSPDKQNGVITGYIINVTHADTFNSTQYYTEGTSINITGLDPYTTYVCVIAAKTSVGIGPFSHLLSVQTKEAVPLVPPAQFTVEVLGNTTDLHFSWVAPSGDGINGVLLGYQLSCTDQNDHILSAVITGTLATLHHAHINTHYTCTVCAFTSVGCGPNAITHISTYENSPVGPPHSLSANTTSTTIQLAWKPPFDPDSLILNYIITYQLISSSFSITIPRPWVTVTNINDTFHTLHSLLASSTYKLIISALTETTTGLSSQPLIITTTSPDDVSPQNLNCHPTSSTSMYCSWSSPVVKEKYEIQKYVLSYKLLDGFDFYPNYGAILKEVTLQPNATYYNINGLLPYGGYTIKVELSYVSDGSEFSGESISPDLIGSTTVPNTTYPEIPSGLVKDITLNVTSPRSIMVSWKPPARKNWRGIISSYRITLIRNDPFDPSRHKRAQPLTTNIFVLPIANDPDPSIATEPLQLETHLLEDLEENFQYTVLIATTNAAGTGTMSDPLIKTMPQAAPSGPPVNITMKTATLSSVNITWQPPSTINANGIITGYHVIFTRNEINDVTRHSLASNQRYFYKNGLTSYEQVSIQVAARTVIGLGPLSPLMNFFTNEQVSGPPQSLEANLVNDTSVVLKWEAPNSFQNNRIIQYQIFYSGYSHQRIIDGPYSKNSQSTMIIIEKLLHGYFYQFKVRAENKAGFSSNITTVLSIPNLESVEAAVTNSANLILPFVLTSVVVVIAIICVVIALIYLKKIKKKVPKNKQEMEAPDQVQPELEKEEDKETPYYIDMVSPSEQSNQQKLEMIEDIYEEINDFSLSHTNLSENSSQESFGLEDKKEVVDEESNQHKLEYEEEVDYLEPVETRAMSHHPAEQKELEIENEPIYDKIDDTEPNDYEELPQL